MVLQPSLADSFNYVTVDAASVGTPFVGSFSIRHTPREWRVENPNDTEEIAAVTRRILDNWPAESAKARPLAESIATSNNAAFAASIARMMH